MSHRSHLIERELSELTNLEDMLDAACTCTYKLATNDMRSKIDENAIVRLEGMKLHLQKFAILLQEAKHYKEATVIMKNKLDGSSDCDVKENEIYEQFKQVLESVVEPDISDKHKQHIDDIENALDPKKSGGSKDMQDSADEDLVVTVSFEAYKDPISKQAIKDPLQNKVCKHYFEKKTIMIYLSNGSRKCPYVGCSNRLAVSDMEEDAELRLKLNSG